MDPMGLMATRNPVNSPLRDLRLAAHPIIYRCFSTSKRWLALGFLNHQQDSDSIGCHVIHSMGFHGFHHVTLVGLGNPGRIQTTGRDRKSTTQTLNVTKRIAIQ